VEIDRGDALCAKQLLVGLRTYETSITLPNAVDINTVAGAGTINSGHGAAPRSSLCIVKLLINK
jgi:hypothetical protein